MTAEDLTSWIGRAVPRLEDARLVRGAGRFLDDIKLDGVLHAAFVRSPVAHGRVHGIEASSAAEMPGVAAVFTYDDLRTVLTCDRIPLALPAGGIRFNVDPFVLVRDEVCYAGEPIALVVAQSRRAARMRPLWSMSTSSRCPP
jgi:carbon-monoxide dehydrogenase large subunit